MKRRMMFGFDFKNRDCIVISSDSEEDESDNSPPSKRCAIVAPLPRRDRARKSSNAQIDSIVNTVSKKLALQRKKKNPGYMKEKQKHLSKARSRAKERHLEEIRLPNSKSSLRNEKKLQRKGLRRSTKKIERYQAHVEDSRNSSTFSSASMEYMKDENSEIMYLLTSTGMLRKTSSNQNILPSHHVSNTNDTNDVEMRNKEVEVVEADDAEDKVEDLSDPSYVEEDKAEDLSDPSDVAENKTEDLSDPSDATEDKAEDLSDPSDAAKDVSSDSEEDSSVSNISRLMSTEHAASVHNKESGASNDSEQYFFNGKREESIRKVLKKQISINDICLSCGDSNIVCAHPLFQGGLCHAHRRLFQQWFFSYDQDGCQAYCSVCCHGDTVVICDQKGCGRCFCPSCINLLACPDHYDKVTSISDWKCYFCCNRDGRILIKKRPDWREKLQELFSEMPGQAKPQPILLLAKPVLPSDRKPIRVLSLFDGIATGLVALKQLGLKIGTFVASEIDENALRLVQNRHPEVIHVGDVTRFTEDDVLRHGPFDLVMGGSPCNDLSGANPRRRGLFDSEGSGRLFFDFFRILQAAKPARPSECSCSALGERRPFFWLFENVLSMKVEHRLDISRFLGCEPVIADAQFVSAAARPRLFWGNLPGLNKLKLIAGPNQPLTVQDCLEANRVATVEKLHTITTNPACLYQGVTKRPPVNHLGKDDVLWSTEIERIFGVPEHYTDINNLGPRERLALLGRSWSIPVMLQILAPLKEYFQST